MSLAEANVAPAFHNRQRLVADDLMRLDDPCVLFEHKGQDSDGVPFYLYTVAGVLDGARLEDGCTIAGEVILIHARSRDDADAIASLGLEDTIASLRGEAAAYLEAHAAMARLSSVGAQARMEAAMKPDSDKSDAFIRDQALIRPLIGDDIVMTTGGKPN